MVGSDGWLELSEPLTDVSNALIGLGRLSLKVGLILSFLSHLFVEPEQLFQQRHGFRGENRLSRQIDRLVLPLGVRLVSRRRHIPVPTRGIFHSTGPAARVFASHHHLTSSP